MFQRFVLLLGLCGFVLQALSAQPPKREFRGVWVATVANIDWPSEPGLSTYEQQQEILDIVDLHKKNGINAIILQGRGRLPSLYTIHWSTGPSKHISREWNCMPGSILTGSTWIPPIP